MRRLCQVAAVAALLGGCSSVPDRFYVLPAKTGLAAASAPASHFAELLPVTVPEALDRAQLVVQQDNNRVSLLDHALWAGSLKSELREGLVRELEHRGVRDIYGGLQPAGVAIYRVQLTIDTLRVWSRQTGQWQASWSVRSIEGKRGALCSASGSIPPAAKGADSVAAAYGAAAAAISAQVADVVRSVAAGTLPAACTGI